VLVHITPPQPSHVSSSENEGGPQQKLGLILYPKKRIFGWSDSLVSAVFPISPFPPFSESTWKHAVFPHFPTTLKTHGNKLSLKTFYKALLISFYSWSGKCRVAIAANVFSFSCVQFGDFSEIVRGVFIFCKRKSDSRVSWVSLQRRFVLLTTGFSV
jgi:hypothetical protein